MSLSIRKLLEKEVVIESAGITLLLMIVERVIGTLRGIIFARLLGPSEYGVFNLAFFFVPLIVALGRLGIPSSYTRYAPQYEIKGMLGDFLRKTYFLTVVISVFFTIISLIFSRQISALIYKTAEYNFIIMLCALTIIPSVMYENITASFNGIRVFKMSSLLRFSQLICFTVIGIVFVILYPKAESAISANLMSSVLVLPVFGFIVWKYILNSDSQNIKIQEDNFYSKIFKFSIWFTFLPIIDTLFNYTGRLVLNRFLGLEEVGIYSMAINIANILFMFGAIANNVLAPNLSHRWEMGERNKVVSHVNLSIKINIVFLMFIAVTLSLFKEQFVSILYGQAYIKSISVLNIMMIFSIFSSITLNLGVFPWLIEKPYIFIVNNVLGLGINLILSYILIPHYHMQGAAIANTISIFVNIVLMNIWLYIFKFKIKAATVFLCIIPICLLLDNMLMSIVFFFLIASILFTDLIFDKNEKNIFLKNFKKALSRYRKS
ncbi:MAG: flippase [Nitrospirae bacterium]|nr:flippase [Nitrospirota bacterium]